MDFTVTTSNWNDPNFWAGIDETAPGHVLDFTALTSDYTVSVDKITARITLSDGTTTFTVGEPGAAGVDATFGGSTQLAYLDDIVGGDGVEAVVFDGPFEDYEIRSDNAGGAIVTAPDGTKTYVSDVEALVFDGAEYGITYPETDEITLVSPDADTLRFASDDGSDIYLQSGDVGQGGDGDDIFRSGFSNAYTAHGGEGDDALYGVNYSQALYGGDGNDTLTGGGDYGTANVDTLDGGAGDDLIQSGFTGTTALNSGDIMDGGTGNDTIEGGTAWDDIAGGLGSDTITGGGGNDHITGGTEGELTYTAVEDANLIANGSFEDDDDVAGYGYVPTGWTKGGTADNSSVVVISGRETEGDQFYAMGAGGVTTGSTLSQVVSLPGNDSYTLGFSVRNGGSGTGAVRIEVIAASGAVLVDQEISMLDNSDQSPSFTFTGDGDVTVRFTHTQGASSFDVDLDAIYLVPTALFEDDDTIDGGAGDDLIFGDQGDDVLFGGDGDDVIEGGDGDDFIKTGQGDDEAYGGDGDDTLMNSAGDDLLVGGAGDDRLIATQGNDTLEGGDGNDTLMGGTDDDELDGGAGDDLLLGDLAGVTFNETGSDGVGLASNITDFPTTALTYELTFSSTADISALSGSDLITLASYATPGDDNELHFFIQSGQIQFTMGNASGGGSGYDPSALFDGNIHTLAFTWDSASGAFEIFADGTSVYAGTYATGETLDQGGTFTLGQEQDSVGGGFLANQIFAGTIYGARLYDDVRTPAEVADTVHAPVADTSDPDLIANWVADPNSATFTDQTGNHPLTMSGDVSATFSEGDDVLKGGTGDDTIYAGGGDDTIIVEDGFGNDSVFGGEDTDGSDIDVLDLSALGDGVTVTYTGDESGVVSDGNGNIIQFSEIEKIILTDQDDAVDGSASTSGLNIDGLDGDDTITGGSGDDTITGGAGKDSIIGGAGNDTIDVSDDAVFGDSGTDVVDAGDGDDAITMGYEDTVYAGDGNDTITADSRGDGSGWSHGAVADGGDGDDLMIGANGAQNFTGGTGNDTLSGGYDYGTQDVDTLDGGAGDDRISSGFTNTAESDHAGDMLIGGAGNDTIEGGAARDTIDGGANNDTIDGGHGDDSIDGGGGDDTIIGGSGDDTIDGDGAPGDLITNGTFDTDASGWNVTNGGRIDSMGLGIGGTNGIGGNGDGSATQTITTEAGESYTLEFDYAFRSTSGGTEDIGTLEVVVDGVVVATYNSGNGADDQTIDFTATGPTTDIEFRYVDDPGSTELGAVSIDNVSVLDIPGDDSIDGGDGSDTFLVSDGFGNDTIVGGEDGDGSDIDVLDLSALGDGVTVTYTGDESGVVSDGNGNTIQFSEIEKIILTDQDDVVDGSADSAGLDIDARDGDDIITGGAGDDSVGGGSGNDTITGGAGDDSLEGGAGEDLFVIQDGFGNDTIAGGETGTDNDLIDLSGLSGPVTVISTGDEEGTITDGTDTVSFSEIERIILTDQDDVVHGDLDTTGLEIDGQGGNDSIVGGSGNDTLITGDGQDTIRGGGGDDSLVSNNTESDGYANLEGGAGADTLDGSAGNYDIASYTSSGSGVNIDLTDGAAEAGGDAAGDRLIGIEQIDASNHDDTIVLDNSGMQVTARDGDDIVTGGSGNDTIQAGDGSDSVTAGDGDDTLEGGTGDDVLTGGDGDDTFVFNVGDGADTITDFNSGNSGALGDGDTTNNDFVDLSSYYTNLVELRADFDDDGALNQSAGDYSDNTEMADGDSLAFSNAERSSFRADNTGVVCFTTGTLIATPRGNLPIEQLRRGDLVLTRDNGPRAILWLGRRHLGPDVLAQHPHLKPVWLGPKLLGTAQPLQVSPQHGVLLCQDGEERLFRAKHLAGLNGGAARVAKGTRRVTYVHMLFDAHQIVFANGAPSESFYPGPQALAALQGSARREVMTLFPQLRGHGQDAFGARARYFAKRSTIPHHLNGLSQVSDVLALA